MRAFLLLFAISIPLLTAYDVNAAEGDIRLDLNLASKHTNASEYTYEGKTESFNELNYGLGVSYDIDGTFEATGGFFRNSYDKNSVYVGVKAKHDFVNGNFVFTPGITVGLVTGYDDTEVDGAVLQPLAVPSAMVTYGQYSGTLGYIPLRLVSSTAETDVVTFQVGYTF